MTALSSRYLLAAALVATSACAQAQQPETFTNSPGMEFVQIAAGSFQMGSPDSDPEARSMEKPQHEVTISQPIWVATTEVTQAQWEQVLGKNPYLRDRSNPYQSRPCMAERITRPDHPATASWNDAQEFFAALNAAEDGPDYRLPTEAEWEYFAGAGTTTRHYFGDDTAQLGEHAWFGAGFAEGGHYPVGQKTQNSWGLTTFTAMSGNGCGTGTQRTTMPPAPPPTRKAPKAAANGSSATAVGIRPAMAGAAPLAATTPPIIAASASAFGWSARSSDGDHDENHPLRI